MIELIDVDEQKASQAALRFLPTLEVDAVRIACLLYTSSYNASKATVIALNVRQFESEIGGRDIVAGNNVEDRNHLLPLYVYDAKAKEYKMLSKTEVSKLSFFGRTTL